MSSLRMKAIGALMMSAIATASPEVALAWPNQASNLIEGTWTVQVTQINCKSRAPLGPPFLSLLTFHTGGTLTETTSNPHFYPGVRGPGHGVWSYLGGRAFHAANLAFITSNGALAEIQTINQQIEVASGANSFVTPNAIVTFAKPDGTPLVSGCASALGKRFE